MSQVIGPNSSSVNVFTAGFPGIYVFVARGANLMGAQLDVNGDAVNNTVVVQGSSTVQLSFNVYLASGDQVNYSGPVADLSAVRLGDEL